MCPYLNEKTYIPIIVILYTFFLFFILFTIISFFILYVSVSTIRLYFPILRKALVLGSSQPWQNVMKILTGQRKLSMAPLQRFFKPLLLWLKNQNKEENIGWARSCPSILPQPDVPSPLNHPHKYLYVSAVPASHLFL